jgi:hypothetical protein
MTGAPQLAVDSLPLSSASREVASKTVQKSSLDGGAAFAATGGVWIRGRCVMRLLQIGIPVAILSGLLWLSPLKAQQPGTRYPANPMPQTSAPMNMDKAVADMQASDARLQALTTKMQSAQGEAKVMAMQDVVNELVQNQLQMHQHMMMMRGHMMESAPK